MTRSRRTSRSSTMRAPARSSIPTIANGIQRLNQEAAKALADGRRAGINISDEVAWTWLSRNPAKALGIFDKTGSLAPGKMADVVLWNGNPFSDLHAARTGVDRRRADVRRQQSQAAAGQRLRARPARRRGREVIAPRSLRAAARGAAAPAARADHRHHQRHGRARRRIGADPGRHRRHPRRRASSPRARCAASCPPARTVIDATGKWVTPGIVAGFSRLGLSEVDLGGDGVGRHQRQRAVQRRDRRRPVDQPAGHDHRRQPRRRGHPRDRRAGGGEEHLRRPGRGDRHRRRHGPDHRGAAFQFVELGETGADKAGGSRSSAHVLFRNALREAAELRRYAPPIARRAAASPTSATRPVVARPQ